MLHRCVGWVNSDFAADPETRSSVTGYILSLNNGPVSWKSKRQDCVTLSLAEAEYVAVSMCPQEVVYVRALLDSFGRTQDSPTELWEDNQSCIFMSENPSHCKYSRHIDTRRYYVRDLVRDGVVKLHKVAGPRNVADANTKSLPGPVFQQHQYYTSPSGVHVGHTGAFPGVLLPHRAGRPDAVTTSDRACSVIDTNYV
eukprot:3009630-Rhodomonas_salina.1